MNAAQAFAAHVPDRWNALHIWNRGTRSLIIVDEALANAVDHNAVTGDDLDVALRAVPYHLREQAPLAIKVLETLKTFLARKEEHQAPGAEMVQMLWGEGSPKHAEQIRKLRGELRAVHFDPALYNEEASQTVDAILEDAEVMLDGYAYYYRQGIQHSLNSSRYLLPEGMPGVVILDLCVHKLAKDLAATFSTEALPLNVAWWGAVDGSNQWADCDVAVIFGLPYMDPRRAINNVFAVSGPQDDAWLQSPPVYSQNANVLDVMMQRDVSASIVQAINRIRCRRVTDPEGRCEKADVYIVLPTDWRGDAILDDVRMNMPGINVAPWDFEPDGPKAYAPRSSSAAESVIGLMRDRKPGPVLLSYVQRELSLSRRQLARLKEELAKATSRITTALGELGVIYRVEGRGRGAKSYLVKAA
jgi:hypothetical protein